MHVCVLSGSLTGTSAESQRKVILMNRSHDCNLSLSMSSRRMTSSPPFLTCVVFHMCLLWKTQRSIESRGKTPEQAEGILPKTGNKTPVSLPLVVLLEILPFYANNAGLYVDWIRCRYPIWVWQCQIRVRKHSSKLPSLCWTFFLRPDDTCAREEWHHLGATALTSRPDSEGSVQSQPHYYLALHPHNLPLLHVTLKASKTRVFVLAAKAEWSCSKQPCTCVRMRASVSTLFRLHCQQWFIFLEQCHL